MPRITKTTSSKPRTASRFDAALETAVYGGSALRQLPPSPWRNLLAIPGALRAYARSLRLRSPDPGWERRTPSADS